MSALMSGPMIIPVFNNVLAFGGQAAPPAWVVPFVFLMVAFAVGLFVWTFSRSRSLLEQWASSNGFEILRREYRNFRKGPFFWTSSKNQVVFYVTVRDRDGKLRSGWVRCGSWILGLLSDQTEVRWES